MTGCYLTTLPWSFMRAMAGFDPLDNRSYFVPRATVKPPSELLSKIFPDLDHWKKEFENETSDVERTIAADGFLALMTWLREVILQDAVFMRELYPDHPIFSDPLFCTPQFLAFAEVVKEVDQAAPMESQTTIIEKAHKAMASGLRDVHHSVATAVRVIQRTERRTEEIATRLDERFNTFETRVIDKVNDALNMRIELKFTPGGRHVKSMEHVLKTPPVRQRQLGDESPLASRSGPAPLNRTRAPVPLVLPEPSPRHEPSALVDREPAVTPQPGAEPAPMPSSLPAPAKIKIDWSGFQTCRDLLDLWKVGKGPLRALDQLNAEHKGTGWRDSSGQQKTLYSLRYSIIKEIRERAVAEEKSEETVANELDLLRLTKGGSLDKVQKFIKEQKKKRNT